MSGRRLTLAARAARALLGRRYVGDHLVQGPHSFHPPRSHDWLEPTLRFIVVGQHPGARRSVAIYCDDTVNKEANLLRPMVRLASWQSSQELGRSGPWPLVRVRWGYLRRSRGDVDRLVRRLSRALVRVPSTGEALYDRRQYVPPGVLFHYSVMLRSTEATIEWHRAARRGDRLARLVIEGCELVEKAFSTVRLRGWTECYDRDLSARNFAGRSHWKWVPTRDR